jgi:hypothetical protein
MKRRTRRILFWCAVIVFGLASYGAIRYAQGYKYDTATHLFVRTGAIAVTANTDAQLYIGDQLVGPLSFLGRRAGRDRLLPGSYTVRLVRDGWSAWHKEAVVREGLLTDFPNVMLLPMNEEAEPILIAEFQEALEGGRTNADATPSPVPSATPQVSLGDWLLVKGTLRFMDTASGSVIATGVLGFSPTDNNDRVLWWTRNELWVHWARGTNYQPYRQEGEIEMLARWTSPILKAAWFRDRDHIVVDLGPQGYRVIETDTRGGVNIIRF